MVYKPLDMSKANIVKVMTITQRMLIASIKVHPSVSLNVFVGTSEFTSHI